MSIKSGFALESEFSFKTSVSERENGSIANTHAAGATIDLLCGPDLGAIVFDQGKPLVLAALAATRSRNGIESRGRPYSIYDLTTVAKGSEQYTTQTESFQGIGRSHHITGGIFGRF